MAVRLGSHQRAARNKRPRRGAHSYAWLGASAITLGIGIGTAAAGSVSLAHADTADFGASPGPARTSTSAVSRQVAASATRHQRPAPATASATSRAGTQGKGASILPAGSAAGAASARHPGAAIDAPTTRAATVATEIVPPVVNGPVPVPPAPGTSYLGTPLPVPGSAVATALIEIRAAQAVLDAQTWGTGNILAGLVSVVPQALLTEASLSLTAWQDSIAGAKAAVANTSGMPIVHEAACLSLLGTLLLPSAAASALDGAALFIPLVGALGAPEAAAIAAPLVAAAQLDGQVYAVVPFVIYGPNEITYVSINGGPRVPVELDTGSSGLSITRQYVGTLGSPTTELKNGGYGQGETAVHYEYYGYAATVDFGYGIIDRSTTVNVVTPGTEQDYNNYQYGDGIVGVLGTGANSGNGPNINVALPGELKDGFLDFRFGSWGVMVLGPNPLPARTSVPGAPLANVMVRINDGPAMPVETNIDSGGVNGDIPAALVGTGQTSGDLPVGTRIAVYTEDGQTLLYRYTTTATNTPTVNADPNTFNTGIEPFRQGPIYFDYSPAGGLGSTYFDFI